MNLKILNSEHFIVSEDAETMKTILFCYSPSRDAIVINEKAPYIDKIVEMMAAYLDLEDLEKKEAADYTQNKSIREYFAILNRIARIRRKLHRAARH